MRPRSCGIYLIYGMSYWRTVRGGQEVYRYAPPNRLPILVLKLTGDIIQKSDIGVSVLPTIIICPPRHQVKIIVR